jgi:hypothetical protein
VHLELSRSTGWGAVETKRFRVPVVDAFRLQLEGLAAAVRGSAAPTPTLPESVVNACTLDALLRSAAERASVAIELPLPLRTAAD